MPKDFSITNQIEEFRVQMANEAMQPGEDILKQSGVSFITKIRIGDSREQICLEARADSAEETPCKDHGMRMIVMGSRGLNAVLRSVLGSVSTGVLHHAPCPVTIVPYSC